MAFYGIPVSHGLHREPIVRILTFFARFVIICCRYKNQISRFDVFFFDMLRQCVILNKKE